MEKVNKNKLEEPGTPKCDQIHQALQNINHHLSVQKQEIATNELRVNNNSKRVRDLEEKVAEMSAHMYKLLDSQGSLIGQLKKASSKRDTYVNYLEKKIVKKNNKIDALKICINTMREDPNPSTTFETTPNLTRINRPVYNMNGTNESSEKKLLTSSSRHKLFPKTSPRVKKSVITVDTYLNNLKVFNENDSYLLAVKKHAKDIKWYDKHEDNVLTSSSDIEEDNQEKGNVTYLLFRFKEFLRLTDPLRGSALCKNKKDKSLWVRGPSGVLITNNHFFISEPLMTEINKFLDEYYSGTEVEEFVINPNYSHIKDNGDINEYIKRFVKGRDHFLSSFHNKNEADESFDSYLKNFITQNNFSDIKQIGYESGNIY